jgi:hypothetical protein
MNPMWTFLCSPKENLDIAISGAHSIVNSRMEIVFTLRARTSPIYAIKGHLNTQTSQNWTGIHCAMTLLAAMTRIEIDGRRTPVAHKADPIIQGYLQICSSGLSGGGTNSSRTNPLSYWAGHFLPSGGLSARKNEDSFIINAIAPNRHGLPRKHE